MSAHPSIKAPFEDVGWAVKGSAEEEDEAAAAAMAKALDRAHKLRASSGRASSSEGGHSQGCASSTGEGGLETVVLRHESGATAEVYLFGATLCSYKSPDGVEHIFVSPGAIFNGAKAIRGGVPVVFPQFGQPDTAMPQHGIARTSTWAVKEIRDSAEEACLTLTLSDSAATRDKWDYAFGLEFAVSLTAVSLTMTLRVANPGPAPFDFHALLHTYFRVPDIGTTVVRGLRGRTYIDKVADGVSRVEAAAEIHLPSFTDRVYLGEAGGAAKPALPSKDVVVGSMGGAAVYAATNVATIDGDPVPCDVVVWNPYEEASPGDLPPPAFKQFVCVEPGLVGKLHTLRPGSVAALSQKIFPM